MTIKAFPPSKIVDCGPIRDAAGMADEIVNQIQRRRLRNSTKGPKRGQLLRWTDRLKAVQDELVLANARIAELEKVRAQTYRWAHEILEAAGTVDIVSRHRGGFNAP